MIEARRHFRSWFLATAAVALLPVLGTGPVQAQYSDSVTVDLSVIGGGYDPGPGMSSGPVVTPYATTPVYGGGTLRMPGSAAPPSRFFPPSGLGMPAAPSGDSVSVPAYAPPKAAAKKKAPPREETAAAPPPAPKKERAEPTAPPARLAKQQQPATAAPAAPALPAAAPEPCFRVMWLSSKVASSDICNVVTASSRVEASARAAARQGNASAKMSA